MRWLTEHFSVNITRELAYDCETGKLLYIRESWVSDVFVCPCFVPTDSH